MYFFRDNGANHGKNTFYTQEASLIEDFCSEFLFFSFKTDGNHYVVFSAYKLFEKITSKLTSNKITKHKLMEKMFCSSKTCFLSNKCSYICFFNSLYKQCFYFVVKMHVCITARSSESI